MSGRLADPGPHLERPDARRRYNRALFDLIAPRYDEFTRWFSFGMDARWKRMLAAEVVRRLPSRGVMLDVACGTGGLLHAIERAGLQWGGRAIGLDASVAMLASARRRLTPRAAAGHRLFVRADMNDLPAARGSVDAVMVGYGLRNAPEVDGCLRELLRVLRPGGVLATLDFYLPRGRRWRRAYLGYLRRAGRLVGWWWHREPHAYGYIEASLRRWMTAAEMTVRMREHGLRVELAVEHLGGGIGLHVVRR